MKFSTYMIKNIITKTLSLAMGCAMAWSLVACDEKDADERYKALPAVESQRVVLLEEYTGQNCVNCPTGHTIISQLAEQYPDNFIGVGIHASGEIGSISEDALDVLKRPGLLNEDGSAYAKEAGVYTLPCGQVNRTTGLLSVDQWAAAVRDALSNPAKMDITVTADYDEATNTVNIFTEICPYDNVNGYLQVWVLEDDITALQKDGNKIDLFYVHNHVLRGAVNGHNGEAVNLVIREDQNFNHSVAVKDIWNPANLDIVVFVYDNSGVQQAAKAKVQGAPESSEE